jgi:tRNA(Arg) A34 adenosine deaminase TadA
MFTHVETTFSFSDMGANLKKAYRIALAEAQQSEVSFRHGATLFRKGQAYGRGCNKYRTIAWAWQQSALPSDHEVRLNNMHAETACMHNVAREKISGKDIFVVRINSSSLLRQSRPCVSCLHNMRKKNIRRVYFSINPNTIGLIILSS